MLNFIATSPLAPLALVGPLLVATLGLYAEMTPVTMTLAILALTAALLLGLLALGRLQKGKK